MPLRAATVAAPMQKLWLEKWPWMLAEGKITQSSGDKLGHRCISTYAGLCLAQLFPMLFQFSALFRYAVASKHWGGGGGGK